MRDFSNASIRLGDTVKVIGTTDCGGFEQECIKIGTICKVVGVMISKNEELIVAIVPLNELPYCGIGESWYLEKDIEKGHMEWVIDQDPREQESA